MSDADDLYAPTEEHEAFRAAVSEVCDAKVAPQRGRGGRTRGVPQGVLRGVGRRGLHAPHVAEAYGGVGADALATVIVIEEIARACASTSLIPAVNKLASLPWLLAGSDELKQTYLPPIARGERWPPTASPNPRPGPTR